MEKFNFEKPRELTDGDVLESLKSDPSNYDIYARWKQQEEAKVVKDGNPEANLILQTRAAKIISEAAKASGNQKLLEYASESLYDVADAAHNEGNATLKDEMLEIRDTLLLIIKTISKNN